MITQLARARTKMRVIATASRPESRRWVLEMGANHVIDGRDRLVDEVREVDPRGADFVFSAYSSHNVAAYGQLLRRGGHVVAIDNASDIRPLKEKSISWHWEYMFARAAYSPEDPYQRLLLDEAARMVDIGSIRPTVGVELGTLSPTTFREAHQLIETSNAVGKIVLPVGW